MRKLFYIMLMLPLLLAGCNQLFEYHPNELRLHSDERELTRKNLERLMQQQPGDTVRIISMGDTQRFYDQAEAFVTAANKLENIDFVVHQGDISDFGLVQEFRWVHDILKGLKVPYFTVVGNHDLLANGRRVYEQMYGPLNYSFVWGGAKFIFIDTNSREWGFNGRVPDVGWLQQELQPNEEQAWEQAVIVSHMAPFSFDFDPELEQDFEQALLGSKRVRLSLHGHDHGWNSREVAEGQLTYHITTTVKKRGFALVKLWKGGYNIEQIHY